MAPCTLFHCSYTFGEWRHITIHSQRNHPPRVKQSSPMTGGGIQNCLTEWISSLRCFHCTRLCCYSTDKAMKRASSDKPRHCSGSSPSLFREQFFIHGMFFCHYHDPISFENDIFQITVRACAGAGAFKRNCPLEFNFACR